MALDAPFQRAGLEGRHAEQGVKGGLALGFDPLAGRILSGIGAVAQAFELVGEGEGGAQPERAAGGRGARGERVAGVVQFQLGQETANRDEGRFGGGRAAAVRAHLRAERQKGGLLA